MNDDHDKVEALLNQALEFKPEERAAFLAGACGGDHDLLHKVETLLISNDEASGFMPDNSTLIEGSTLSEGPGTVIDRYKLLQQIGEGGMGVVYMAQQEKPVKRKVALKIIKMGMDTKNVVARFEAERQALAMMDHPNIARVLDGGATETGRPYFVMELVQGVPITEFCDKNKLPSHERLELFMPVCHAIQSAHQKGIIHRDIKPSNVLVTLHHGEPMAKVIDFGIAKATNQKLTEKTLFTNYAQMIGTPAYMSPEQAEMSSMDVDTRTDVYSLGVLLYELLTGTTPFSSKRLSSMAYGELQRVIAEEEPQKPSTRMSTMEEEKKTVTAKNRGVDIVALSKQFKGDIDWIVMKCLEKDRRRRYDSPKELVVDLKHFLNNEPVSAAAPSLGYQLQKLYRRNKAVVVMASSIAIILTSATFISSWLAVKATQAEREATSLKDEMQIEKDKAETARRESDRRLYAQYVDRARLARALAEPGFRTKTEIFLKQAAALETDVKDMLNMRNAAMGVMLQPFSIEPEKLIDRTFQGAMGAERNPARDEVALIQDDNSIAIMGIRAGALLTVLRHDALPPLKLRFGSDGDTLFALHKGGGLRIWKKLTSTRWRMQRQLPLVEGEGFIDTKSGELIEIDAGNTGFAVAVSGSDQLRFWQNVEDSSPTQLTLPANFESGPGRSLALSPDGRWLGVILRGEGELIFLDTENSTVVRRHAIEKLPESVRAYLAFSPDGRFLSWGCQGDFELYRSDTFDLHFKSHEGSSLEGDKFDFSPDGTQILYGRGPVNVHLLDANQPRSILVGEPSDYFFGRDAGDLLQARTLADDRVTVHLWPITTGEFVELMRHDRPVKGITFHPFEPLALTSSEDRTVRFWNLDDGHQVHRIETPSGGAEDVMFSPDGTFMVTALEDAVGTVQFRDTHTREIFKEFEFGTAVRSVVFNEATPQLCMSGTNSVKVWSYKIDGNASPANSVKLELLKQFSDPEMGTVTTVRFSPDGRYLAWFETGLNFDDDRADQATGIRTWDLERHQELPFLIKASAAWNSFDFIDGHSRMAVSSPDGGIDVWNLAEEARESRIGESDGNLKQMDVSSDGRYIAFSTDSREFGIVNLETEELLFTAPNLSADVWQIRWSKDGSRLGIVEGSGRARVLNITAIRSKLAELGLDW